MDHYDVIVLGLGGMGASTVHELARRGRRVLGLEQFSLVHDHGSSHGQTRVIRKAYYEHAAYVPLLQRAYERWYDLEQVTGRRLFVECGCLSLGLPGSDLLAGVQRSAAEHGLPIERLSATEVPRRFPAFQVPGDMEGVLERDAGFLYVEECVRSHLDEARRLGAYLHVEEPVIAWRTIGSGVEVETPRGRYHAGRLVIAAGPWQRSLLADLGAKLNVMRQVLLWYGTRDDAMFRRDRFPCYIAVLPWGNFYGFPLVNAAGLKVAQHYGASEQSHPDEIDRQAHPTDELPVRRFLDTFLPAAVGPLRQATTCIYTLTPDRHFILDTHPDYPQVSIAAGFSGHGYKFASVVGEVMADLADAGRTTHPIEMFRITRFRP